MNICDKCGYKVVSNKLFARHMETHAIDPVTPEVSVQETPEVQEIVAEVPPVVEEVSVIPEVREDPIKPVSDEITLHFTKSIEVYINGIPYVGKDITVKNMSIAAEIVRIAREAYGPLILA